MLASAVSRLYLESVAFYLRRSPWEMGRWRLILQALPLTRSLMTQKQFRTVRTRHGFRLRVNQGDWLGGHVFLTGDYEPPTAALILKLLKPGDMFVDVGANIGFFTVLGSRAVGPTGRVLAFEPLAAARAELERNIRLNQCRNVVVHDEAVSDRESTNDYYAGPEDHQGISSLRSLSNASAVGQVQTIRLDDRIPTDHVVTLVKIDVEGAEYRVLDGFTERLILDRPDLIIEVTDAYLRELGNSSRTLRARLTSLGYQMYLIDEDRLIPVDTDSPEPAAQYNAFFTTRPLTTG